MVELPRGTRIHRRYVVEGTLGEGGLATVLVARDLLSDTAVALKLVDIREPSRFDALRGEFVVLSRVFHPRLCRVHDFGTTRVGDDVVAYYTSDVVLGMPIDAFAANRAWPTIRQAFVDGLTALAMLHRAGFCHGDFKPENLLVDSSGRGTLLDLSCARMLSADGGGGSLSGTPGYVAPELKRGAPPDRRSDLYAAGVTLTRILEALGEPPPPTVRALCERLVHVDRAARPSEVDEVLDLLHVAPNEIDRAPIATRGLFGRSEALEALSSAFDALEDGRVGPRAIVMLGPPGIGRTRMLQEAKWIAQRRFTVVEADARQPLAMWSMLRRAIDASALRDGLGAALEAHARLASSNERTVLVIDDEHLLEESQREILWTLVRLLQPTDPVLVLATTLDVPPNPPPALKAVELAPLGAEDLGRWMGERPQARRVAEVLERTAGLPGEMHLAGDIAHVTGPSRSASSETEWAARVASLPSEARTALALCIANDGRLSAAAYRDLGVDPSSLAHLVASRWLAPSDGAFRIARGGEGASIARALGDAELRACHTALAGWFDTHGTDDLPRTVARARHRALAGGLDAALVCLEDNRAVLAAHPAAFVAVADALAASRELSALLAAAEILEDAGHPQRATTALARALRSGPDDAARARIWTRAGACQLKLGNGRRALRCLARARSHAQDDDARVRIADLEARALIQQGSYDEAAETARAAYDRTADQAARANLLEDLGVASTYLGRTEEAARFLASAEELQGRAASPRARVRLQSYRAIHAYRIGDLAEAIKRYRHALEIAEEHGLTDQLASAELNLGTVQHRRGEWGASLESYERGLRVSVAVGKLRTEVALRYNLAQLYLDVGLLERAMEQVSAAREPASAGGLEFLLAAIDMIDGEIALSAGRPDPAREALTRARATFESLRAQRESAEVDLVMAEVALASRDTGEARRAVTAAATTLEACGANDLDARLGLVRARIETAEGRSTLALSSLEEALRLARRHELRDLEAEIESSLGHCLDQVQASRAARAHRERAIALWERCAATLPAHLRDGVWAHPRRRLAREAPAAEPRAEPSSREKKLDRLLAINARLISSLDPNEVLEHTMDAAIELTNAERGFLILASDTDKLRVAVARNLDRERIKSSELKFSRSIAERVIASGEPVVIAEAQLDARFASNVSVHAMKLESVISVPIRTRDGILGALYLDNRFQRGRFGREDLEILLGFADQAAIALSNARLHEELERRNRQLERERRRIAVMLDDKSREVERLADEVQRTRRALDHRYEYGSIVGRSAAMQRIFTTLDRVTPTDLTVLIQGESGTGKELVARAIHSTGPRRDAAFVSINCAAVPEALLESELFGHARGAFTGADRDRVGLFEHAGQGTLFLDEIGELPIGMQVKLLRVIQEREVRPVGTTRSVAVSARIVCATNRVLRDEVTAGRFREDLYYRVAVVEIAIPPLRERLEDLPDLAQHLLEHRAEEMQRAVPKLTPAALRKLLSFPWPGNVRQLGNVLSSALVFSNGDEMGHEDIVLPDRPRDAPPLVAARESFEARERAQIVMALDTTRWNVTAVCQMLGIPRTSLYRKLEKYGIERRARR